MRISDWSSDVCSSDLPLIVVVARHVGGIEARALGPGTIAPERLVLVEAVPRAEIEIEQVEQQIVIAALRRVDRRACLRVIDREIGRASCRERVCKYV